MVRAGLDAAADAIDRLMAPDALIHDLPTPDGASMRGPAAFKPFHQKFLAAFPDIRIDVVRTIVDGDMVAAHCTVTVTHGGDGLGMPPTGRQATISGMAIARVENDKLVEGWNCFDFSRCISSSDCCLPYRERRQGFLAPPQQPGDTTGGTRAAFARRRTRVAAQDARADRVDAGPQPASGMCLGGNRRHTQSRNCLTPGDPSDGRDTTRTSTMASGSLIGLTATPLGACGSVSGIP